MSKEVVLESGETCPNGYVRFHYLDVHERCRPYRRYLIMPRDTPPEKRLTWGGRDVDVKNATTKAEVDKSSYHAWQSGAPAWALYDVPLRKFAYTGQPAAHLRRLIEKTGRDLERMENRLSALREELDAIEESKSRS